MKYIENKDKDVYFNLALEEYVFNNFKEDSYLLLWRNENSIVLGKHQNIYEEISTLAAEKMGVRVARRNTGGGTVFHDTGNLNYSFITHHGQDPSIEYDKFLNPVISALRTLGIPAEKRRDCDIAIEGKKISGSAEAIKGGRILHHGTLLFNSDLSRLNEILKPSEGKIISKAVKSVKSPVTNIKSFIKDKNMTIEEFEELLLKALFPMGIERIKLTDEELVKIRELAENKYVLWAWNYGNSPKFVYEKESRLLDMDIYVKLKVDKGIILSSEITVNKISNTDISEALQGAFYNYQELLKRFEAIKSIENINKEELALCFF